LHKCLEKQWRRVAWIYTHDAVAIDKERMVVVANVAAGCIKAIIGDGSNKVMK
jgi:hypothetical protein